MKIVPARYKPASCTADCHDWITAEEIITAALGAFYANCRHLDDGVAAFGASGTFNADSRRQFADDVAELFLAKLHDRGFRRQVPGFEGWASETLAQWDRKYVDKSAQTLPDIHRRASQNENL